MPGHAPVQHNDDETTTAACNQSATAGGQFIIATPRHAAVCRELARCRRRDRRLSTHRAANPLEMQRQTDDSKVGKVRRGERAV